MRKLFNTPLRATIAAVISLAMAAGIAKAVDNYAATAGSGLTFAAKLVSAVLYPQFLISDPVTPSQIANVTAAGAVKVDPSAVTQPVNITGGLNANITPTDAFANQAAAPTGTFTFVWNGTTWDRTPGTAAGGTKVISSNQYPSTAVPYTASATGTTGATTATLTGASSVTTYICGFSIRANATAAVTDFATVTGTITGTLSFAQWTAPLASGIGVVEQIFSPCVPASAVNTSIAVVSAAPGTGGKVSVTAWGYKL